MRAPAPGTGSGPALNRVIAAPPGSDQAGSAVRCLSELHRQGAKASIVVRGLMRRRYLQSRLPFEARGRGVISYLPYLQELWSSALRTPYAWVDEHALDLWEFRRQLAESDARDLAQRDHAVILHGQQLPVEFYSLLRLLSVPTTVYADSGAIVSEDGATLDEMSRALGVPAVTVLQEKARTTIPIYDFFHYLRPAGARFSSHRPDRPGARPLLWHHETLDGEAQFVERYALENPRSRIGLLVPLAELATAFRRALIPGLGDQVQWYLAEAEVPPENKVDPGAPGVKILTWSSAAGLEFDTVVLAGLHYASNGQSARQLATSLQLLSASATTQLVLSYSGVGEPPALSLLPRQLLDVRAAPAPAALLPPPAGPVLSPPAAPSRLRMDTVARVPPASPPPPARPPRRSAADIARALLAEPGDRKSRRRVLTAEEEVGLAQLMRGPAGDLSAELPHGFRATLPRGDERAAAFDAMVTHNDGLVRSLIRTQAGGGLEDEDVYQHGFFGLMRAVEKFDASLGTKFSTYATSWIRQSMSRGVANEGTAIRVPVHVHAKMHQVTAARGVLLSRQGHAPISAISQVTGLDPDKVAEYLRLSAGVVSLDAPLRGGDPDSSIGDLVPIAPDGLTTLDELIDRQGSIELVQQALARMDDREAWVLRLRFGFDGQDDQTLDQIGKLCGVTRERIRQIEKKAKAQLINELAALGATGRTSPAAEPIPPATARRAARPARHPAPRPAPRPVTRPTAARLAASLPVLPPATGPAAPTRAPADEPPRPEDFCVKRVGRVLAAGTRRTLPGDSDAPAPDLRTWLRDLIDQGLASLATRIEIQSNQSGPWSWLVLAHDGETSAWAVLRGRLLRGFGEDSVITRPWPVFAAALSLFDEVIVWRTGTLGDGQRSLVLASSQDTGAWSLHDGAGPPPAAARNAADNGSCSLVVFRAPRLRCNVTDLEDAWAALRSELGLSLSELLTSRITLTIGGQQVTPRDPFLWRNPAAQDLGTERITAGGHSALVNPRVLPHPSRLLSGDRYAAGDPAEWEGTQGFYVRCEQRYLSCAGWLGLAGLDASAGTALARVAVEIDPAERRAWGLSEPGRAATPPEPLRPRLAALAGLARRRSEQVLAR